MTEIVHTFADNPLDRGDALRRDPAWLEAVARDPDARYLPMWRLNALIAAGNAHRLGWLPPERVATLDLPTPPVFLGLEGGAPRFGQDVSAVDVPCRHSRSRKGTSSRIAGLRGWRLPPMMPASSPNAARSSRGTNGTSSAASAAHVPSKPAADMCAYVRRAAHSISRAPIRWRSW